MVQNGRFVFQVTRRGGAFMRPGQGCLRALLQTCRSQLCALIGRTRRAGGMLEIAALERHLEHARAKMHQMALRGGSPARARPPVGAGLVLCYLRHSYLLLKRHRCQRASRGVAPERGTHAQEDDRGAFRAVRGCHGRRGRAWRVLVHEPAQRVQVRARQHRGRGLEGQHRWCQRRVQLEHADRRPRGLRGRHQQHQRGVDASGAPLGQRHAGRHHARGLLARPGDSGQ